MIRILPVTVFPSWTWILLVLLTLFVVGCGKSDPPLGTLTGVVTSNDVPVDDCRVRLYHPDTRRYSGAKVDSEGKFSIGKLTLGNYQVSVTQKPPTTMKNDPFDKRIPGKYRKAKTSGFEVVIVEGDNQLDLKMSH